MLRAHEYGLRIGVAYAADADPALHILDIFFKLCPKRRVLDAVDASLETAFGVICDHTAALCPEM